MEYSKGMSLAGCYIIWNPGSSLPPKKLFGSKKDATDVAKIMAKKNPGDVFVVCRLEATALVGDVVVNDFAEPLKPKGPVKRWPNGEPYSGPFNGTYG